MSAFPVQTLYLLRRISTAPPTTQLFKRGLRNAFMQGVRPLGRYDANLVGPAFTLRNIPAREDLDNVTVFADPEHPQRKAIEITPAGHVLVIDCRGDTEPPAPATPRFISRITRIWPAQAPRVSPRQSITSTCPAGVNSIRLALGMLRIGAEHGDIVPHLRGPPCCAPEGGADQVPADPAERADALHERISQPALEQLRGQRRGADPAQQIERLTGKAGHLVGPFRRSCLSEPAAPVVGVQTSGPDPDPCDLPRPWHMWRASPRGSLRPGRRPMVLRRECSALGYTGGLPPDPGARADADKSRLLLCLCARSRCWSSRF